MTTMAELDRRTCQHDEDIAEIYKELGDHGKQLRDHGRQLRQHGRQLQEHTRQLNWLMTAMVDLMTYVGVDAPPIPVEPDEEDGEEEPDEEE